MKDPRDNTVKENLTHLRNYLESEILPEVDNKRLQLRMKGYGDVTIHDVELGKPACGTAACMMGYAPFVPEFRPILSDASEDLSLAMYIDLTLFDEPELQDEHGGPMDDSKWSYMFGQHNSNDLREGIDRIDEVIEKL